MKDAEEKECRRVEGKTPGGTTKGSISWTKRGLQKIKVVREGEKGGKTAGKEGEDYTIQLL